MKCGLCGYSFDERQMVQACSGCIFSKGCQLTRCPRCAYEWPKDKREEKLSVFTQLNIGDKRKILSIGTNEDVILEKIISLGILPGLDITLVRKSPAILCEIGYTHIALDEEIAKFILVRKE